MSTIKAHLAWFKLKCPYPPNSQTYKQAYAKLNNATYANLERLRAEFDDGSIPMRHYKHKGQWYSKPLSGGTAQKLNMKGIQRHGRKWRVQKRTNGQLRKWTFGTYQETAAKRNAIFA